MCILFHDEVDFLFFVYEELESENSQAVMNSIIKLNSLYTKVSSLFGTPAQCRNRIVSGIQGFSDYRYRCFCFLSDSQ